MRWMVLIGLLLVACAPSQFCTDITDAYERDDCLLKTGLELNESGACDEIKNENWQMWCYTDVAANTKDAAVCEGIAKVETRQHCVKDVAIGTGDVELCHEIAATAAGDECYRTIALGRLDPSLCTKVAVEGQRNKCYVDVAQNVDDYTICTYITNDEERHDGCIFRTSLRANATEACAEMLTENFSNVCYYNHAVKLLNKEICAGITYEPMQRSCRAAVNIESQKASQ